MTRCPECGVDKEAAGRDLKKLEDLIKMLMELMNKDKQLKNWSNKLGDMVTKMDEADKDA